jgi:outer membrane protein insertion porin family
MLELWRPLSSSMKTSGLAILACIFIFSCVTPKKYPVNKPFVFETKINIQGNLSPADKLDLQTRLQNQLDDSLKTRTVTKRVFTKQLIEPAVFDTNYAHQTVGYMRALLGAQGFMNPSVAWDSTLTIFENQQRVSVQFKVAPGKRLRIDSLGYAMRDTSLQMIAIRTMGRSNLKKGEPYSLDAVTEEIDRLVEVYRNNGYFRLSKEDLIAEVDTVVAGLINPNLDPFEQLQLLEEVRKRRENPTINVIFKQRGKETPARLQQYHVRNVNIYPDLRILEDTTSGHFNKVTIDSVSVLSRFNKFKPHFLVKNNYLTPGALYRQRNYFKTTNTFSQLGAWQQVTADVRADDSLHLVDFDIKLYPAPKYGLTTSLEASRNTTDLLTTSNLFGLGVNFGLNNRNMARESIRANTNLRFGIELGKNLVQTFQTSLTHNIVIPRFLLPFRVPNEQNLFTKNTLINFNASTTRRKDFFTLNILNGSIGYEWSKGYEAANKRRLWNYTPFNVELLRVVKQGDSLDNLFRQIPNLENSFKNGLIISQSLVFRSIHTTKNKQTAFKAGIEESGGLFGLFKGLDINQGLYRYVRVDVDYRHYIDYKKSSWAFRLYGGVGVPYGSDTGANNTIIRERTLPFVRGFFAGGPSSMRGWQVRRLGPGSNRYFDSTGFDRFGDVQFEGNVEYRFTLGTVFGVKLKSAFFTDIGNVWYRNTQNNPKLVNSDIKFDRFYKDLAVDGGTSLRFDFTYFLIRLDYAYKLKDPYYADVNAGWFQHLRLFNGQLQLGINYPF